ncbi:MAG: hypothetical protein ACM3S1_00085 [Hyphomicrobiales bacterium]
MASVLNRMALAVAAPAALAAIVGGAAAFAGQSNEGDSTSNSNSPSTLLQEPTETPATPSPEGKDGCPHDRGGNGTGDEGTVDPSQF